MNRIGLHIGYWWGSGVEHDLFQMLELTHRAELDTIEINPAWLLKLTNAECEVFAARLREYGMTATLNGRSGRDERYRVGRSGGAAGGNHIL